MTIYDDLIKQRNFDFSRYYGFYYSDDKEKEVLILEVPGYSKDDLTISIKKNNLFVNGEKEGFKKINKSVPINSDVVDVKKTKAFVENGIMTIKFAFKEPYEDQEFIQIE